LAEKRYYWLKLKEGFFNQKEIKKLRSIAGGDTYTIIYLKMQLKSLENNGSLYYEGFEDDFCNELALEIDESPENVKVTLLYLEKHNLIEKIDNENIDEFLLPAVIENTGTETATAVRVRRHREKKKALQCNTKSLQCNSNVTPLKQFVNGEIELEKEKEIEKKKKKFKPPTIEEIKEYLKEKDISNFDYNYFYTYFNDNKWIDSRGNKVKNWKQKLLTWHRNEYAVLKKKKDIYEVL
jgi:predicted phage replisome organizer